MDYRHPLSPIAHFLERTFGWAAFPGPVRILVVFQVAATLLSAFVPGYSQLLVLDKAKIVEHYEVWRLVTFLFVNNMPVDSVLLVLFLVFFLLFMWMINDGLESVWGTFRVNLYLFGTWLGMILAAWIVPANLQSSLAGIESMVLYSSLFMAFATLHPTQEIRLMMILPVQVRWVAVVLGILLVRNAVVLYLTSPPGLNWMAPLPIVLGMFPYMLVFAPGFFHHLAHRGETVARQSRFRAKQMPQGDAFNVCTRCGISDRDRPELEFRVGNDGEDYCSNCLPKS